MLAPIDRLDAGIDPRDARGERLAIAAGPRAITSFVARALVIAVLVALATPAVAAPPASVYARTELRLKPVRKDYNGDYVVSGTLVDRFSGEGLAGRQVLLDIVGGQYADETDDEGKFEMTVPGVTGKQDLVVRFGGDDQPDAASLQTDDVDVDVDVDADRSTDQRVGGRHRRTPPIAPPQATTSVPPPLPPTGTPWP